jgi:hypothetical protein
MAAASICSWSVQWLAMSEHGTNPPTHSPLTTRLKSQNMSALVPIGSSLERSLGTIKLAWLMASLLLVSDALYLALAYIPALAGLYAGFAAQCAVGASGVIFALLVVETHAAGGAMRSVFGLFSVPARLYPLALVALWQLLVPQASLIGHLAGLAAGQAHVAGLLRPLGPSAAVVRVLEARLPRCAASPAFVPFPGGDVDDMYESLAGGGAAGAAEAGGGGWRLPWAAAAAAGVAPPTADGASGSGSAPAAAAAKAEKAPG